MDYWLNIKKQIDCNDNKFTFGRTQEVQERYIRFKSNISNIYNHLIETLFNKNENLVFKENDFPYQFEDQENILHYLIWINPSNKKKINARNINKFLSDKILSLDLDILDYILFKNNSVNKSVETIEHYHVLFLVK